MNRFFLTFYFVFFLIASMFGMVQTKIDHNTMDTRIGYPAIIAPGGDYPSVKVTALDAGMIECKIVREETGEAPFKPSGNMESICAGPLEK